MINIIVLISGSSHSGKTLLAQKLLNKHNFPYLSIDHLKMGLIRSNNTTLTPDDDAKLTDYLWPIVKEIIKTAIENNQNLIVEGCYIPFNWKDYFDEEYLSKIKFICLIMTTNYINNRFSDIKNFANVIETRLDDSDCTKDKLIKENELNFKMCDKYNCDYILINDSYDFDINLDLD